MHLLLWLQFDSAMVERRGKIFLHSLQGAMSKLLALQTFLVPTHYEVGVNKFGGNK